MFVTNMFDAASEDKRAAFKEKLSVHRGLK